MLEILYELATSKEYALFYSNPQQPDKFKFGYILAVNEKEIALHEISPDGKFDGVIVMESERIFRVEKNSRYGDKMMKLYSDPKILDWLTPIDQNRIFYSVLSNVALKEKVVSVELYDSGYYATSGFVDQVQNGQCTIRQIDDYGYDDGITSFFISDVSELVVSSDIETRIEKLWKINKNTEDAHSF